MLDRIDGDVVCKVIEHERAKGNKPATINRYLALMRCLLRTARNEWQWIEVIPKIRLLRGEVERDRPVADQGASRKPHRGVFSASRR